MLSIIIILQNKDRWITITDIERRSLNNFVTLRLNPGETGSESEDYDFKDLLLIGEGYSPLKNM